MMSEKEKMKAGPDIHEQLDFVLKHASPKSTDALAGTIWTYYQDELKGQRRTYAAPHGTREKFLKSFELQTTGMVFTLVFSEKSHLQGKRHDRPKADRFYLLCTSSLRFAHRP
jgi:hypothetical protein